MFDYSQFNLWAVLVAALVSFVIGGLWYGPLFGKAWMKAWGLSEEDLQKGHPALVYGGAFVLQVIAAWALAMLAAGQGWHVGLHWGLIAGVCFAVTANGTDYLFERRSLNLFWLNGGYKVVNFAVMGAIIGAW